MVHRSTATVIWNVSEVGLKLRVQGIKVRSQNCFDAGQSNLRITEKFYEQQKHSSNSIFQASSPLTEFPSEFHHFIAKHQNVHIFAFQWKVEIIQKVKYIG